VRLPSGSWRVRKWILITIKLPCSFKTARLKLNTPYGLELDLKLLLLLFFYILGFVTKRRSGSDMATWRPVTTRTNQEWY
jgi:hypothetical protein